MRKPVDRPAPGTGQRLLHGFGVVSTFPVNVPRSPLTRFEARAQSSAQKFLARALRFFHCSPFVMKSTMPFP